MHRIGNQKRSSGRLIKSDDPVVESELRIGDSLPGESAGPSPKDGLDLRKKLVRKVTDGPTCKRNAGCLSPAKAEKEAPHRGKRVADKLSLLAIA